jgi:hypothetical protein
LNDPSHSPNESNVHEAFERHIAPTREALSALLDAADRLIDKWGYLPAADSPAMAELAAEAQFTGGTAWGKDPIQAAHNLGHLLLFAVGDCARALVRVLSEEHSPVYAHVVLARASLEHASRAWWLFEPAIGLRLRVARGMNERIFGLSQQTRLPLTEQDRTRASNRVNELLTEAARLGFDTVRGPSNRRYLEEIRPGQTKMIDKIFSSPDGNDSLGALVYGAFSAVAHGTTFGLTPSVQADGPRAPRTPGLTWGAVYTSSGDVVSVLTAVTLATEAAHRRRNELFGWASQSWEETAGLAIQTAKDSLPAREP